MTMTLSRCLLPPPPQRPRKRAPQSKQSLKELEALWYKKLKDEEGFNDIENTSHPARYLKAWHHLHFARRERTCRQRYFYYATHFLNSSQGHSVLGQGVTRLMWELHSNGLSLREISLELQKHGYQISKTILGKKITDLRNYLFDFIDSEQTRERPPDDPPTSP